MKIKLHFNSEGYGCILEAKRASKYKFLRNYTRPGQLTQALLHDKAHLSASRLFNFMCHIVQGHGANYSVNLTLLK